MAKRKTSRAAARELIDTTSDKRFVRRRSSGQFQESDDVGRSMKGDRRTAARTTVRSGQGDKGDRRPATGARRAAKKR